MPFAPFQLNDQRHVLPGISFGVGSSWRGNRTKQDDELIHEGVVKAVKDAINVGFRSFDAAENYFNEKSIGKGLRESGIPREHIFLATKIMTSLSDIPLSLKRQLAYLQTDYLDMYLIHSPYFVPEGKTLLSLWREMEKLVDEGLVRSIGVSNFEKKHLEQILPHARIKPAVNQLSIYPYVYERQQETIAYCKEHQIAIQAYEIASSIIRDTEKNGPVDPVLDHIETQFASIGINATPGQILLQWAATKGFSVVSTSSKPGRMAEYLRAGNIHLKAEQIADIDKAGQEGASQGKGAYTTWNSLPAHVFQK